MIVSFISIQAVSIATELSAEIKFTQEGERVRTDFCEIYFAGALAAPGVGVGLALI